MLISLAACSAFGPIEKRPSFSGPRREGADILTVVACLRRPDPTRSLASDWPELPRFDEEDLALVASGTGAERRIALAHLASALELGNALVLLEHDGIERAVPVSSPEARDGLDASLREALAQEHEDEAARAFERAESAASPEAIGTALARFPFSSRAPHARRMRAELLLERGDIVEAAFALGDALDFAPPEEQAAGRELLARVRRLATDAVSSLTTSVQPGGRLEILIDRTRFRCGGLNGKPAVFGKNPARRSWIQELPGFVECCFVAGDLGVFDCGEHRGPDGCGRARCPPLRNDPMLVALDESGCERWNAALPRLAGRARLHAVGLGRIFSTDGQRVVALDARTGRILWGRSETATIHVLTNEEAWLAPDDQCPGCWNSGSPELALKGLTVELKRGRRLLRLDARDGAVLYDSAAAALCGSTQREGTRP